MRTLKIGNVELDNPYILAPMAGVTDLPFRLLCKEQGAGLLCMEMVSAKAIQYNNRNTKALLEIHPEEEPEVVVFPEDSEEMSPEEMLADNMQQEQQHILQTTSSLTTKYFIRVKLH